MGDLPRIFISTVTSELRGIRQRIADILRDASPSSCIVFKTPSPREREIALLLVDRYSDKDIAQRLGIGVGTARTHLDRMRKRAG
jgi:DNA-binding NarL/FixJ family response regulator